MIRKNARGAPQRRCRWSTRDETAHRPRDHRGRRQVLCRCPLSPRPPRAPGGRRGGRGGTGRSNRQPTDKCPVCGMFVAKYPDWVTQAVYRDGCLRRLRRRQGHVQVSAQPAGVRTVTPAVDIGALYVTDYYSLTPIDGKQALVRRRQRRVRSHGPRADPLCQRARGAAVHGRPQGQAPAPLRGGHGGRPEGAGLMRLSRSAAFFAVVALLLRTRPARRAGCRTPAARAPRRASPRTGRWPAGSCSPTSASSPTRATPGTRRSRITTAPSRTTRWPWSTSPRARWSCRPRTSPAARRPGRMSRDP